MHETWQVDAKENMQLANGKNVCWLSVVDEKSGAIIGTIVFPYKKYRKSS